MADIFLSYAREDEPRARPLAAALESRGWSVWWDRHIPSPGDTVANYTQQHPNRAGCVVVLWSKASRYSDFVLREAAMAENGRLVEVIFEPGAEPAPRWRPGVAVDLAQWNGETSDAALDRLAVLIRKIVAPSLPAAAPRKGAVGHQQVEQDKIEAIRREGAPAQTAKRASATRVPSAGRSHLKQRAPLAAARSSVIRRIFLCYRRDDSGTIVGRLYDRLAREFGDENIFKDVDNIPFGVDFVDHLDHEVQKAGILFAVIGARWLDARLDDPNDFVRIELVSALRRTIPVVPILVDGAQMPRADQLPDDLRSLTRRQGIMVRHDPDFHADVTRLLTRLG